MSESPKITFKARTALIELRNAYVSELMHIAKKEHRHEVYMFLERHKHTANIQFDPTVLNNLTVSESE